MERAPRDLHPRRLVAYGEFGFVEAWPPEIERTPSLPTALTAHRKSARRTTGFGEWVPCFAEIEPLHVPPSDWGAVWLLANSSTMSATVHACEPTLIPLEQRFAASMHSMLRWLFAVRLATGAVVRYRRTTA